MGQHFRCLPEPVGEREHSELGASICKRWWNCGYSVRAARALPNTSSAYAEEGTRAHLLAETCLRSGQDAIEYVDRQVGGAMVTAEMAEHVQTYLDVCRSVMASSASWLVEARIDLAQFDPPAPMFGTLDFAAYSGVKRRLTIVDLKYGQGVRVEAEGNPQLRYYALGALLLLDPAAEVQEIEAVIVQPRAPGGDPVRRVKLDPFDLTEWSVELVERARAALDPDSLAHPGDWCRFCPAAGKCPARAEATLAVAQMEFARVVAGEATPPPEIRLLTVEQMAAILAVAPQVEAFIRDLRAAARAELSAGRPVPGWKLVATKPVSRWSDEAEAELALSVTHGLPDCRLFKPRELISPAQARTLLAERDYAAAKEVGAKLTKKKAEADAKAALAPIVKSESSGVDVVPESDPRPAILAGSEFAALPSPTPDQEDQ